MKHLLYSVCFLCCSIFLFSQEGLKPLSSNINYLYKDLTPLPLSVETENDSKKRPAASLFIPFVDDFFYACTKQYPNPALWKNDSSTYVNTGYPKAPPSIGVVTFDGLNKHGYPYRPNEQNLTLSHPADTLTSSPINLFTTANSQTLMPTDKIGLSFYYQARGYGEAPEQNDSLILDLFKPNQNKWNSRVWFTKGVSNPNANDTAFKRVFIWIKDTAYLRDGFRFQFRNSATTAGDFDHWHLDYVYLNQGRDSIADTTYNDVTFGYIPTPLLKDYSAMPYQQYLSAEMASNNWVALKNNYTFSLNIYYEHKIYQEDNNALLKTYSAQADNIPPFKYYGYFKNPAFSNPASQSTFNFQFPDPLSDSTDFKIKHYVYRNGANTDFIVENDTVIQRHKFRNYYSFDDGSAEGGYYVTGINGKMALKFRVNVPDTFRAVRIYFDPAPLGSAQKFYFRIKLWQGPSVPGAEIPMKDTLYYPVFYQHGYKEVPEYVLPNPILLSPGTYFIGIQQQLSTGLVVGFDKNYDSKSNLFYDSGSGWTQSSIRGSLMLRPVFGAEIPHPMSVKKGNIKLQPSYSVFPNPSNEKFSILSKQFANASYALVNELGQVVLQGAIESLDFEIETRGIHSGMYLLIVKENGLPVQQQKIIIQK